MGGTDISHQLVDMGAHPLYNLLPDGGTPPRSLPVQGVTTQISEPKIRIACTADR